MTQAPVTLGRREQDVVAAAVQEHCQHRGWELLALAVRSNHVHTVIAVSETPPEGMMGALKARATRWLREEGLVGPQARVWAYHGSTRYLWDGKSVNAAVAHVGEGQDVAR